MPMLKNMRDNLSPVYISSESQRKKLSQVPAKCHWRFCRQVYTRMSSVAGYSAMAVYILSDAELRISKNLTALKKGINISKVQFLARLDDVQEELLYNPQRRRWRRRWRRRRR